MSEEKKNLTRSIEAVIRPVFMVLALVGLLFMAFAKEGKAEMTAELGAPFLSGEFAEGAALFLEQRWDKWGCGMGYLTEQVVRPRTEPKQDVRPNLWVQCQRYATMGSRDQWEFGVGPAYFNSTNRALGSNFTAALSIGYDFNEKWGVKVRHWSNAGSASPNMGQDLLTIEYSFN